MNRKLTFLIFTFLSIQSSFAGTGSEQAKIVAMGIVGGLIALFVTVYRNVKDSGVTTKEGRKQNRIQKQISQFDKDISELKIIHHKGIIDDKTLETKIAECKQKQKDLKVNFYLEKNDKYNSVMRAFQKGFITEVQKEEKISEIRERIEKNVW